MLFFHPSTSLLYRYIYRNIQGLGLIDPYGSLPTSDILDSVVCASAEVFQSKGCCVMCISEIKILKETAKAVTKYHAFYRFI